jgi:hypothetical protein
VVALGVMALLLGGFAGLLAPTRWALLAAGLLALAWEVLHRPRMPEPALVLWVLALLALALLNWPLRLIFWDEFSHWGTFPRFLIETAELPRQLGDIIFLEYPPGWGLFAFFLLRDAGFKEGALLFAASGLQATLMLPLLAGLQWRQVLIWAPLTFALAFFPAAFGLLYYGWTAVEVDNMTPLAAVGGLAIYLQSGRGRVGVALAGPMLSLAVLMKGSGTPMAAAVGLALLLDQAWLNRGLGWRAGTLAVVRVIWPAAVMPLMILMAWSAHVSALGQPHIWDTSWSTVSTRIAEPDFPTYAARIARDFFAALGGAQTFSNLKLTLAGWLLVFAGLAVSAIAVWRRETALVLLIHGALLLGFLLYGSLLLGYFLVAFLPYEALRLGGMERYLSSYFQLWALGGFVLLLSGLDASGGRRWAGIPLVIAWSLALPAGLGGAGLRLALNAPRAGEFAESVARKRAMVAEAAQQVRLAVPQSSSLYILSNATTGLEYYASMFEAKPRRTSTPTYVAMPGLRRMHDDELWCHSLGPKRFDGDVWSCPWTLERLEHELEGWDYVLIMTIDRPFLEIFGGLFAEPQGPTVFGLFRIEHQDGRLRLVPALPGPPRASR